MAARRNRGLGARRADRGGGEPEALGPTSSVAWPADATRFLALRLRPGDDLRIELERAFADAPERAGFVVASVGSLSRLALRHAGRDGADVVEGSFELVGLSGTFSVDGPHLHLLVSDPDGRVTGGHLLPGVHGAHDGGGRDRARARRSLHAGRWTTGRAMRSWPSMTARATAVRRRRSPRASRLAREARQPRRPSFAVSAESSSATGRPSSPGRAVPRHRQAPHGAVRGDQPRRAAAHALLAAGLVGHARPAGPVDESPWPRPGGGLVGHALDDVAQAPRRSRTTRPPGRGPGTCPAGGGRSASGIDASSARRPAASASE